MEPWQTVLPLPDTVGEECARTGAFETSLFNICASVTSVRWHFGSTIKIQQWPCCFHNQLSMHNIPAVCATWISPRPGFSSALIPKKRETFHSTLKKEKLCVLIREGREESYEKQTNQGWYSFALSWKKLNWSLCDPESTMTITRRGLQCEWTEYPSILPFLIRVGGWTEYIPSIAWWTSGRNAYYLLPKEKEILFTEYPTLTSCWGHLGCYMIVIEAVAVIYFHKWLNDITAVDSDFFSVLVISTEHLENKNKINP